jgi:tight adherence protein C
MSILLAFMIIVGLVLLFVGLSLMREDRFSMQLAAHRLAELAEQQAGLTEDVEDFELRQPFSQRVFRPFLRNLAEALSNLQQRLTKQRIHFGSPDAIQDKLDLAGAYKWAPADYLGAKALGGLALGGFLALTFLIGDQPAYAGSFGLVGAVMGWFAPDLLLRSWTRRRQKAIQRVLPSTLDLLAVSAQAGLGLDGSLLRLVEKRNDELSREFARVLAEMRIGRSRREAFKALVVRTQVPDLSNFVAAVLQADQLGVSITNVLRAQAHHMRVLRRQRGEAAAARLPVKLIFPLAIFIFPALCVVILGPIWPYLSKVTLPT